MCIMNLPNRKDSSARIARPVQFVSGNDRALHAADGDYFLRSTSDKIREGSCARDDRRGHF